MRKLYTLFAFVMIAFVFSSCNKDSNSTSEKFKVDPMPVIQQAMKDKKYLILVFESEECRYCTKLNKEVLNDLKVKEKAIKNNVEIAIINAYGKRPVIDPEAGTQMNEQYLAYVYRVQGFPTIAIFDPTQNYKLLYKITGFLPKEDFINLLDFVGSGCYKKMKYEQFIENGKHC